MADLLNDAQFKVLKNYCKIDQSFDDNVLKQLVDSGAMEIARAIDDTKEPNDFIKDSRFFVALMKFVEEDYYYRGTGSEVMRFPLQNPTVVNVINQLRSELPQGSDDNATD